MIGGGVIRGSAVISQNARVWNGRIYDEARICGAANIDNKAAIIYGNALIGGVICINGPAKICGKCANTG
jgi:hypothetical protein